MRTTGKQYLYIKRCANYYKCSVKYQYTFILQLVKIRKNKMLGFLLKFRIVLVVTLISGLKTQRPIWFFKNLTF